jgi:DNA-3-methyladenine glycosylase
MQQDPLEFLGYDALVVAPRLLGCTLIREIDGRVISAKIVETEAYDQTDPASHSFRGKTARTAAMFGAHGHAYIYFTYGMHYCLNVVTGKEGFGSGVLIRAVEPLDGIEVIRENRRGISKDILLTDGPAKITKAFKINKDLYGHNLRHLPLQLVPGQEISKQNIVQTTRIGIKNAADQPWRFYIKDNPFVSKP